MPHKKIFFSLLLILTMFLLAAGPPPPAEYTAQRDDTLPRLAEKYYRTPQAWPALLPADSPPSLRPGQRLLLPARAEATADQPPAIAPVGPAWLADFSGYVADARRHFEIPGAALAIVKDGQIVLAQGYGVRQLGQPEPVTPETVFGIGSTTKAMSSMLVASLVDEGRVRWDEPVIDLWPQFTLSEPIVIDKITLRHLLSMSSGLPRADLVWSGSGLTAAQVMASLADLPVLAPPGERFEYNNQAYATGIYAATLAAGGQPGQLENDYAHLLQQRVFDPIGMTRATLNLAAVQADSNHATPHDFSLGDGTRPTHFHADPGITPAGAVNASLWDMARFLQTELNRGLSPAGQRVVSAENLTETWRSNLEAYPDTGYGMGWFVENYQGVTLVWHEGDVLGFKSLLVMIPEANAGLVLLTNRIISYGFANSVRYRFAEQLYRLPGESAGEFFKTQWTNFVDSLPELRGPLPPTLPAEAVSVYVGQYADGWRVEHHPDGTLWAIRGDYQWQLWPTGPGQFTIANGFGITTPLEFVPADGQILMRFEFGTGEKGEYRRLGP